MDNGECSMQINIIDAHYFASSYRHTQRSTPLHNVAYDATMETYLKYAKGGHSDRNERTSLDCKGGGRAVTIVRRGSEALAEKQATSRLYRFRLLAYETGVCERVPGKAIEHAHRGKLNCKLILSAEVTRQSSKVVQATDESLAGNSCLFCSIAYLGWQRKQAEACYLFARKRDVM